ncbi:MAG TPA: DHA2 family efflux MFS transporter permease subunit [Acidimicrobiales bacterium]|nr:DHA2 family efflux MFS transporter permease subunit [Acidimicrobiales bacterium]
MTTTLDQSDASGPAASVAAGLARSKAVWAVVITGLALFMASLDNLVVSTALPVIRVNLHAGLSGLEWTVNAYTLTFAVLLLSAAAVGERIGRRRTFIIGIAVFTLASAAAAFAPSIGVLVAARAIQGAGVAMIMPLSLTLLSAAVPPERRNAALGIWGAIGGMAVAIGPLVGGAVTTGWAWQYIFWLNVPIGLILVPLAWWKLSESRGRASRLDIGGVVLASIGLFGVVYGLVQGNSHGWTSTGVLTSFVVGVAGLAAFVWWELRVENPMLPLRLFKNRAFAAVNVTAMLFSFGMFGSIFFLSQFLQTVQGYSPLSAGIRVLPWTGVTMLLAPVVGLLAERIGGKILVVTGLVFQAVGLFWLATIVTPTTPYLDMVPAFVIAGVGMTLFFVPLASLVLSSVPKALEGVASGTNSAFRELGGVLGIAVLGAVFSSSGSYSSGQAYVNGLTPAITVGAVVVAIGAFTAMLVPAVRRSRRRKGEAMALEASDAAPGEESDVTAEWAGSAPQPDGGDGEGARELEPALACSALSVESR